jgi:DNA polymerase/3'-5' exonuclease PolX
LKKEGKKSVKGEIRDTKSEEDIFKIVEMEYVEPKNRK